MSNPKIVYKIRNKTTGLFSGGGAYPRWSKKGKVWTSMGNLRNHLNMFKTYRSGFSPQFKDELSSWEVIEYHITMAEQEKETNPTAMDVVKRDV